MDIGKPLRVINVEPLKLRADDLDEAATRPNPAAAPADLPTREVEINPIPRTLTGRTTSELPT
ncbi:MAG: hypothetical protein GY720_12120 [bacterium]|nr:hypothetical protein [bacterium]